jgi:hypothetical protein
MSMMAQELLTAVPRSPLLLLMLLMLLLQGLRDMCTAEGAVLCFDEVMTGFRIARGCAQVGCDTWRYNCSFGFVICHQLRGS